MFTSQPVSTKKRPLLPFSCGMDNFMMGANESDFATPTFVSLVGLGTESCALSTVPGSAERWDDEPTGSFPSCCLGDPERASIWADLSHWGRRFEGVGGRRSLDRVTDLDVGQGTKIP